MSQSAGEYIARRLGNVGGQSTGQQTAKGGSSAQGAAEFIRQRVSRPRVNETIDREQHAAIIRQEWQKKAAQDSAAAHVAAAESEPSAADRLVNDYKSQMEAYRNKTSAETDLKRLEDYYNRGNLTDEEYNERWTALYNEVQSYGDVEKPTRPMIGIEDYANDTDTTGSLDDSSRKRVQELLELMQQNQQELGYWDEAQKRNRPDGREYLAAQKRYNERYGKYADEYQKLTGYAAPTGSEWQLSDAKKRLEELGAQLDEMDAANHDRFYNSDPINDPEYAEYLEQVQKIQNQYDEAKAEVKRLTDAAKDESKSRIKSASELQGIEAKTDEELAAAQEEMDAAYLSLMEDPDVDWDEAQQRYDEAEENYNRIKQLSDYFHDVADSRENDARLTERQRKLAKYDTLELEPDFEATVEKAMEPYLNGTASRKEDPVGWELNDWDRNELGYTAGGMSLPDYYYLSDNEKKRYYYLLGAYGRSAAMEYIDDMAVTLDKRRTEVANANTEIAYGTSGVVGKVGLNAMTVPAQLAGNISAPISDLISAASGEYNPYSIGHAPMNFSNTIRTETAQDIMNSIDDPTWGKIGANTYQALMSAADSAAGAMLFGAGYTWMMGGGAASQRAQELYEKGASDVEIGIGAVGAGLIEVLTESYSIESFTEQFLKGNVTGIMDGLKKTLIQGLNEGSEEVASDLLNLALDAMVEASSSDYRQAMNAMIANGMTPEEAKKQAFLNQAEDTFWSLYGGFVSGGLMGGFGTAVNAATSDARKTGKALFESGQYSEIIDTAQELRPKDRIAQKLKSRESKGKIGKRGSDFAKITNLYQQNIADLTNRDIENVKSAVQQRAEAMGVKEGSAEHIAEGVVKQLTGKKPSMTERYAMAQNKSVAETLLGDIRDSNTPGKRTDSNAWVREIGAYTLDPRSFGTRETETQAAARNSVMGQLQEAADSIFGQEHAKAIGMVYQPGQNRGTYVAEMAKAYKAGQNGTELGTVEGLSTLTNAQAQLAYNLGKNSVNADSYAYDADAQGQSYVASTNAPVNISGISAIRGGSMILNTDDGSTVSASDVKFGDYGTARLYRTIADMGVSVNTGNTILDAAKESGMGSSAFAVAVRDAYDAGRNGVAIDNLGRDSNAMQLDEATRRIAWEAGRSSVNEQVESRRKSIDQGKHRKKQGGVTVEDSAKSITMNEQQKSGMDAAKVLGAMGIDVTVYASTEAERKAGMENGNISLADGGIRVDLNAGVDGQGVMAFALSHEFTHFVEEMSPAKFRAFTDILFSESGIENVSEMISAKAAQLGKTDAYKGLSENALNDIAYSEVTAEMMETALTDTDVLSRISSRLQQTDKSLWGKIKDFLKGLVDRLKAAYQGMNPDSSIARLARQSIRSSENALNAFADAASDAIVNYNLQDGSASTAKPASSTVNTVESIAGTKSTVDTAISAVNTTESITRAESSAAGVQKNTAQGNAEQSVKRTEYGEFVAAVSDDILKNTDPVLWSGEDKANAIIAAREALAKFGEIVVYDITDDQFGNICQVSTEQMRSGKLLPMTSSNYKGVAIGNVLMEAGENQYSVKVYVGKTQSGENVYFGVSDIRPTQFTVAEGDSNAAAPTDVRHSLRMNGELQTKAEALNRKNGFVADDVMEKASEVRNAIASIMLDPELQDALGLPPDIAGNTFFEDSSYGGSEENTTVCPRSMGAEALLDAVSDLLGRPLTVDEQIIVSQEMQNLTANPECVYCYVATDRKAYREFLGKYVEQRDWVIRNLSKYSDTKTYSAKQIADMTAEQKQNSLYVQFLDGRKPTKNMASRFTLWLRANNSGNLLQMSDLASISRLDALQAEDFAGLDKDMAAQVKDAMRYAQSASWAKKRVGYTAYNGHILNWSQKRIDNLNSQYGLRMYSFSDFSPAFILENMQMVTDASTKGLKMLAYTKDLNFVKIFAKTGMNINVSCFGFEVGGNVYENNLQGATWAEAQKLREQNPNVGVVFVTYNDAMTKWAMQQDWVDVVIPYHLVRTGTKVAEAFGFTNYTDISGDKKITESWVKGKDAAHITPPMHNNDLNTYLKACEENHLTPRFQKFLNDPALRPFYMKLVNETRRSAQETPTVQPVFDQRAAEISLQDMRNQGGYFQPIGGSVDRMMEIAMEISGKLQDGQKNNAQEGVRFSQREFAADAKRFSEGITQWDNGGRDADARFILGSTGEVLQGLGAIESDIYMDADKINSILQDHPEITLDEIRNIPQVLNDPILILKSRNAGRGGAPNTRMVMFGSIKGKNGLPVMTVFDLRPRENHFVIDDMQKVTSSYTKTTDPVSFIKDSFVLYADKKRTTSLLRSIGFHMPIELLQSGYIGTISYSKRNVNIRGENFSKVFRGEITLQSARQSQEVKQALEDYRYQRDVEFKAMKAVYDAERSQIEQAHRAEMKALEDSYKGDTATMSREFVRLLREYDKQGLSREKLEQKLSEEAKKRSDAKKDNATWEKEFKRLLREYDKQGENVDRLESEIEKQQQDAKEAVENAQKVEERLKLERVISDINRRLLSPTKTLYVPDSLQPAVTTAMQSIATIQQQGAAETARKVTERYEEILARLRKNPGKNAKAIEETQARLANILARQKATVQNSLDRMQDAYAELTRVNQGVFTQEYNEGIIGLIQDAKNAIGDTFYGDLSIKQLKAVRDAYTGILKAIRDANRMHGKNLREGYAQTAKAAMAEFRAQPDKSPALGALKKETEKFSWNNEKPFYAFQRLGNDTLMTLYENMRDGEDGWYRDFNEARAYMLGTMDKYHYDQWKDNLVEVAMEDGGTVALDLQERMSLYAASRRDQAVDHLTGGGFILKDSKRNGKDYSDYTSHILSQEAVMEIRNGGLLELTQEQIDFVSDMQAYLSTVCAQKNNEISRALYGVSKAKEQYYWPLKSSGVRSDRVRSSQEFTGNRQKNAGHMKATAKHASNAIDLSGFMNTWADHVNDTAMYHNFTLPMEDFYRVYNYKSDTDSLRQQILRTNGEAAVGYIDTLLKDINGGVRADNRASAFNMLLTGFKKGAVSASLSVAIQQPSAIGRAFSVIDPKYFIGMKVDGVRGINNTWEEMKQYAPVAGLKDIGRFDTDMGRSTREMLSGKNETGLKAALDTLGGWLPEQMDKVTWCAIWEASKRQVKAQDSSLSGDALKAKAGKLFTQCITQTQVYDSVFSRSGNMRSKETGMKMLTSFMAEPTTTINMVESAVRDIMKGNKRAGAKKLASVGTALVLNSVLASIVYAARDDDEEKTLLEKYLSSLTSELVDGLNPITYYPGAKDVWSIFQGYDVDRSDMSLVSAIAKTVGKSVKAWRKYVETDPEDEEGRKGNLQEFGIASLDAAADIANLFGIPAKNVLRELRAVKNTYETVTGGRKSDAYTRGRAIWDGFVENAPAMFRTTESKTDRLYKAIVAGSDAELDRLKSSYDTDKKYENAIATALSGNDGRIRQAAKSKVSGDAQGAEKILSEIEKEGHFTRDQIDKAFEKQLAKIPGGTKSSVKDQFVSGETDQSGAVKQLTTVMGMEQEDAEAEVRKWGSVAQTGIEYADIQDEYLNGGLTETKAAEMLVKYGGKTSDAAKQTVKQWGCEKDLGIAYSDIKTAYQKGELTDAQLKTALTRYGGKSAQDAEQILTVCRFKKQNPTSDLTDGQIESYLREIDGYGKSAQDAGIRPEVYAEYKNRFAQCKGTDADGDGKTDSGSKKSEVLAMIDSLAISDSQKDALYYASGYASSGLRRTPWHAG